VERMRRETPEDMTVRRTETQREPRPADAAQFPETVEPAEVDDVKAWELIDAEVGRYMPRRIRGSFRGRALG